MSKRLDTIAGHLSVELSASANSELVTIQKHAGIAVLTIRNPPVNAFGIHVAEQVAAVLESLLNDKGVLGIVIQGHNSFVAGADIKAMRQSVPPVDSAFRKVFSLLEGASKPIVASITLFALGGGLEIALACSGRVAHDSAQLGLPEQQLGLIPGWGGTQRLPRLIGVAKSLEMILKGQSISGTEAAELGLIDAVVSEPSLVLAKAIEMARQPKPSQTVLFRRLSESDVEVSEMLLQEAERRVSVAVGVIHPKAAIDAIRACIRNNLTPLAGLEEEQRLIRECGAHPAHGALRHVFLARRESAKVPNLAPSNRRWSKIGIVGAGKMGSGIALSILLETSDVTVWITDVSEKVLASCITYCEGELSRKGFDGKGVVAKRLFTTTVLEDLKDVECVIEAATENLALKQRIFRNIVAVVGPTCVLATNTSSIDLTRILVDSSPALASRLIGSHFFNPPSVMVLLEIIRTQETSDSVVADWLSFAKRLKKVPIVVRNCVGFTANRTFFPYGACAGWLVSQRLLSPYAIDKELLKFGIPIGSFALADLVGLDVGLDVDAVKAEAYGERLTPAGTKQMQESLVKAGRLGRSTGRGWYIYEKGSRMPKEDPDLVAKFASVQPLTTAAEGVRMMLFLCANEGARLMEEGMVIRESDIDVATVLGFGFPPQFGGLMYWARTLGWPIIVKELQRWEAQFKLPLFSVSKWALSQISK